MAPEPADLQVLRAKYLDWCSARLAEQFLQLTPDEIYELAQQAFPAEPAELDSAAAAGSPAPLPAPEGGVRAGSYSELVGRVTEALAARLALPSFSEWVAAYRAAPEQYEEELLGFWKKEQ